VRKRFTWYVDDALATIALSKRTFEQTERTSDADGRTRNHE